MQQLMEPKIDTTLTVYLSFFNFYNTITNCILIIYVMSNSDRVLGVMLQIRAFGGNRTHNPYANSLAHYPLDCQGTLFANYNVEI